MHGPGGSPASVTAEAHAVRRETLCTNSVGPETWAMLPVAECDQVLDGCDDPGLVVDVRRPTRARFRAAGPITTVGRPRSSSSCGPQVVDPHVGEEDAVDAAVGGQPAVALVLAALVADDLQHQGVAPLGQDGLDAGDEGGEERVCAERLGGAGDDQPHGKRAGDRQRPAPKAGRPAQVTGDGEDPLARVRGDPRPVVEREGHRRLRDARDPGDVGDGGR